MASHPSARTHISVQGSTSGTQPTFSTGVLKSQRALPSPASRRLHGLLTAPQGCQQPPGSARGLLRVRRLLCAAGMRDWGRHVSGKQVYQASVHLPPEAMQEQDVEPEFLTAGELWPVLLLHAFKFLLAQKGARWQEAGSSLMWFNTSRSIDHGRFPSRASLWTSFSRVFQRLSLHHPLQRKALFFIFFHLCLSLTQVRDKSLTIIHAGEK